MIDGQIVERPYQTRAIRRIGEAFEDHNLRKALVVMATGAGKTLSGFLPTLAELGARPGPGPAGGWQAARRGAGQDPRHQRGDWHHRNGSRLSIHGFVATEHLVQLGFLLRGQHLADFEQVMGTVVAGLGLHVADGL